MTGAPAYAPRMRHAALSLLIVTACGGSPPRPAGPEPQSGPDLSPALAPVRWMVGDWEHPGGREHWVATAGVFYGVGFLTDGGFEAMVIDDAPADAEGKPDGVLRLFAMPGGAAETVFTAAAADPDALRFANPQHDDPQVIAYAPGGDALTATVSGPRGELVIAMTAVTGEPAPEAEAADVAFARATDADGADGWVAAFAADGAMMRAGQRVEGPAIRATIAPLLARADLLWEPAWSRRSPDGQWAATVGRARIVDHARVTWRGSYLTIWRAEADGWKVVFDVGRGEQPL